MLIASVCALPELETLTMELPKQKTKKGKTSVQELIKNAVSRSQGTLSVREQDQLQSFLLKWAHIFSTSQTDLGRTDIVQHTIDTGTVRPIKQAPRRLAPAEQEELKTELGKLLEAGIGVPSAPPWASALVLVGKKDGSLRICVDYRKLNQITKKDAHPLPRVDDLLDTLSGSKLSPS